MVLTADGVFGVSAGDSEAWVVTDGEVDDLTRTQSRRRLGSGRAAPVAFDRRQLDGALVVGTDGLFKYASSERIATAVRGCRPAEGTERLVELVRLRSGSLHDDVGIAVVAAQ